MKDVVLSKRKESVIPEVSDYNKIRIEKIKEIEKGFDELVWKHLNSMSNGDRNDVIKTLANKFLHTHRTLQQSLIGLIYGVFKELVSMNIGSDLRNEQSVKFIKDCVDKDYYFPFV